MWTTFTSEQIDIDVRHREGRRYLTAILDRLSGAGVRTIRLDAIGYAIKQAGTTCFMIPETFDFIAEVTADARARGMEVLVEVHGHYQEQLAIAAQVDRVYDFALPPLVLHTLYTRNASALAHWLSVRPTNCVTVLDTHDGIGVIDVAGAPGGAPGLLAAADIASLVDTIHARSGGTSRLASGSAASNVDAGQINCTFYDALGRRDAEYLIARAIQCCVPGIPQIYYVGLLAGANDMDLLRRTGTGRDINRHFYTAGELAADLRRPVVRRLIDLLRIRNNHPAFAGTFTLSSNNAERFTGSWDHGREFARLDVDLTRMAASLRCSTPGSAAGSLAWTVEGREST